MKKLIVKRAGYAVALSVLVLMVWFGRGGQSGGQKGPEPSPQFVCADVDGRDGINITDPIYLLNWLFLGGPPPVCAQEPPACDLTPVVSQLQGVQSAIREIPSCDLQPVVAELQGVQSAIREVPSCDLQPLVQGLEGLRSSLDAFAASQKEVTPWQYHSVDLRGEPSTAQRFAVAGAGLLHAVSAKSPSGRGVNILDGPEGPGERKLIGRFGGSEELKILDVPYLQGIWFDIAEVGAATDVTVTILYRAN